MIALSTTEAEYIATTHAEKEALWLRIFIVEITQPLTCPVMVYCDNQSAILVSKNDQYHIRMKPIDIHHHFIHMQQRRDYSLLPTAQQLRTQLTPS